MDRPGSQTMALHVGTVDGLFTLAVDLAARSVALFSASLHGSPIHAIAISPADSRIVVAGCGDPGAGLYYSHDGGLSWEAPGMWRLGREVWSLAFDRRDPRVILAGTQPPGIFRSQDVGYTWEKVTRFEDFPGQEMWTFPHPPHEAHVRKLAFHPGDPKSLFAAVEVGGLLCSDDSGQSWRLVPGVDPDVHSLAFSSAEHGAMLVATGRGLFRSSIDGEFTRVPADIVGCYIASLAVHPAKPTRVYTVARGARALISVSEDGGTTFNPISRDLPAPAYGVDALALHPTDLATIFYGARDPGQPSRGCLFVSTEEGHSWSPLGADLDLPPVTRLACSP